MSEKNNYSLAVAQMAARNVAQQQNRGEYVIQGHSRSPLSVPL